MTADIPTLIEHMDHALTVKELVCIINVSGSSLYAQCKRGRIPYFLVGGSIRFDPHTIAQWLRSQTFHEG